jgi:Txe/YoeB family toxin of Txe-Axe toxin-antitoxin module
VTLILDIARNPDQGIGKPEPLKHKLRGYWSQRITERRSNTLPLPSNVSHPR